MQSITTVDGRNITIVDYPALITHRVYTDDELKKIKKLSKEMRKLFEESGIKLYCNGKEFKSLK